MTKIEKVIKALELEIQYPQGWACRNECPYYGKTECDCFTQASKDALELLKEREPVEPKEVNMYPRGQYACGFCGHISVGSKDYHAKFCPECGRALKWE